MNIPKQAVEAAGHTIYAPLCYGLDDYVAALSGDGPLASKWDDKPNRLIYDLIKALRPNPAALPFVGVERRDGDGEAIANWLRQNAHRFMGPPAWEGSSYDWNAIAKELARSLPAQSGSGVREDVARGWIVTTANEDRFRMWGDFGPEWTDERHKAILFARRDDAEAFARDDEDAWKILPQNIVQARSADEDEAYELGKRDGYEEAIQELDIATGGDGEFKGSTFPGATVDVPAMKRRVIDRLALPKPAGQPVEGWREVVSDLVRASVELMDANERWGLTSRRNRAVIAAAKAIANANRLLSPAPASPQPREGEK